MANNMNFLYEAITNKILALLEKGTAPWKKSWKASDQPINLKSKIPYRGINVWTLLTSPHATTPYWLTGKQVFELKGTIKPDETKNYETVIFFKILKYNKKNKNGEDKEDTYPLIRYTRAYNLGQCEFPQDVLDKIVPKTEVREINKLEECESIVKGYKDCPEINFGGDRAYYAPMFDRIQMPTHESFVNDETYYSTLFHEMAHSTGAPKRINRFKATDSHIFGSETYSKEELVAEMTASFLCAEANIETKTLENSAAYLQGWMKAIKNGDKNLVVSAASQASYAASYILGKKQHAETE